jgi:putative glycosyltransferase (TIGR04372 family)
MIINTFFKHFNKVSPVIVQTPWVGAIGNCAEEIYFGLLRARREKKKVLFLFPIEFWRFKFSKCGLGINRELLKVESKYRFLRYDNSMSKLLCISLTALYCGFKIIDYLLGKSIGRSLHPDYLTPNIGQMELWYDGGNDLKKACEKYKWDQQLAEYIDVHLPEDSVKSAEICRVQMGLPIDAWFVCIHVRESGYYGKFDTGKIKTARNCDIFSYLKAIKHITDKGGWVIRMGDATMKKLPQMPKVIDYPHTKYKSHLMDIYLIKECKYYIGTVSGIWDVAGLFQKSTMTANLTPCLLSYPLRGRDVGAYKHIFSDEHKRFLCMSEIYEIYLDRAEDIYDSSRFKYHENTPAEIFELLTEFLQRQDNPFEISDQQKSFFETRSIERFIRSRLYLEMPFGNRYRIASRLAGYRGVIGRKFLETNWSANGRSV